jgi:hypothetical protein
MSIKNNITFLVNSCDSYEDLWKPFFLSLKKYWIEFDYPIVLNTETKKFTFNSFDIVCNGSSHAKWGGRFLDNLKKIKTEYVIIFFDDYLINKYVDVLRIRSCFAVLEQNSDASVCYLVDITKHQGVDLQTNKQSGAETIQSQYSDFQLIPRSLNYRLNSAPAIWRVADLIKFTNVDDTPWVWEFFGSARTYKTKKKFFCISKDKCDIVSYVNDRGMGGAIHRGEWLISAIKFIEENLGLQVKDKTLRPIKFSAENQPHSFRWKIKFLIDGFRAVGFDALIFVYRSIIKNCLRFFTK